MDFIERKWDEDFVVIFPNIIPKLRRLSLVRQFFVTSHRTTPYHNMSQH
jgi:hypothetical protein